MREFCELVETMRRLRGPGGCPWDQEQSHETLKPYLLEESYEALEAVDSGDPAKLCAELGDVLLQVVFHAQIAEENDRFDIAAVCKRINDKLIYRHPHVFSDVQVSGSDQVVDNWEQLKRREKEAATRDSALDGIPVALPALMHATDVQKKAARVGFDWADIDGPLEKIDEELGELQQARAGGDREQVIHELGDLLFAVVNVARFLKIDAEDALRMACRRFDARFRQMEEQAAARGTSLREMTLEQMDGLWEDAKEST
jgi:tetrapyrrole methylase family protein/MazG family protein